MRQWKGSAVFVVVVALKRESELDTREAGGKQGGVGGGGNNPQVGWVLLGP